MLQRLSTWSFGLALMAPALGCAQVDLSGLDKGMAGPRSEVLVLGSVHLSQLPKGAHVTPAQLQPVIDRLAAYRPGIITIEGLSGETCDLMARHPAVYDADDVKTYCPDTSAARAATGLDVPAAIAESRRLLDSWPKQPTPAQRRHLAAVFLAAGDPVSAVVQWLQLPDAERHAGDGLSEALVQQLRKGESRPNESNQIAAVLAARLGLQRVYPVDDHTGDNIAIDDPAAYGKAIRAAWAQAAPRARSMRERGDELATKGDMLGLYRFINDPANQQLTSESDFGAALKDPSPQHYGQRYVAGWEGRNLRMVANIRSSFSDRPGARVLVIVGATHKPWFDRWLGQLQGVDMVDAEKILDATAG
ncbi:DUF5694 domain-containing protein [Dyella sp. C9]|uniref:DUF5694 domain-containing protein n=1 Tax=Dyella sp. C9 TaxID=2202154 RepID=UPI000DF01E09|nr:DUF5694 domain-containing protein [Dyella sp. C9]